MYETPPKRELKQKELTLIQCQLVPSCMIYFGWRDLDETKPSDGPFMNMAALKDKLV